MGRHQSHSEGMNSSMWPITMPPVPVQQPVRQVASHHRIKAIEKCEKQRFEELSCATERLSRIWTWSSSSVFDRKGWLQHSPQSAQTRGALVHSCGLYVVNRQEAGCLAFRKSPVVVCVDPFGLIATFRTRFSALGSDQGWLSHGLAGALVRRTVPVLCSLATRVV